MAKIKHIVVKENTRVLFNEIKGQVIKENPKKRNFAGDNNALHFILKDYKKLKRW